MEIQKSAEHSNVFLVSSFLISLLLAAFIAQIVSRSIGTEAQKNIIWTAFWIHLTIITFKYSGYKSLFLYPLFLISSIVISLLPINAEAHLILNILLNLGGLIVFCFYYENQKQKYIELNSLNSLRKKREERTNRSEISSISSKEKNIKKSSSDIPFEKTIVNKQEVLMQHNEDLWEEVLTEFEGNNRKKGLWAKAFSESDGNEAKAKAKYLRWRVEQLESYCRDENKRDVEFVALSKKLKSAGYRLIGSENENKWEIKLPSGTSMFVYSLEDLQEKSKKILAKANPTDTSKEIKNVKRPVNLANLVLSGLSTEQKKLAIEYATELADCGSSLHGSKNSWGIKRGTSTTYAYSLQDLTEKVQQHIKHYRSNKRE